MQCGKHQGIQDAKGSGPSTREMLAYHDHHSRRHGHHGRRQGVIGVAGGDHGNVGIGGWLSSTTQGWAAEVEGVQTEWMTRAGYRDESLDNLLDVLNDRNFPCNFHNLLHNPIHRHLHGNLRACDVVS